MTADHHRTRQERIIEISFAGSNGFKYSRRVVDPTVFDKVKVGDKVDITWNTDITVTVN